MSKINTRVSLFIGIILTNLNYFVYKLVSDLKEISGINNSSSNPRCVLVAPLDWGLGHATRCIPLINELLDAGFEVIIASAGLQRALLNAEFPQIENVDLPGYSLKYTRHGWQFPFSIFLQIPKILTAIKLEKQWLSRLLRKRTIDFVIADNRYGLHSDSTYSIFMTHQLAIQVPYSRILQSLINRINRRLISSFQECWIPDNASGSGLSGALAHPATLPSTPVQYIGILSRFRNLPVVTEQGRLLIMISGPEPQRTIFEKLALSEITAYSGKVILLRGLPGNNEKLYTPLNLTVYNHLPAPDLNKEICAAEYVIARSGYSTIMDLIKLSKKMILIPTPGQTEQEYLAKYLHQNQFAFSIQQRKFSLSHAVTDASKFPYKPFSDDDPGALERAVGGITNE